MRTQQTHRSIPHPATSVSCGANANKSIRCDEFVLCLKALFFFGIFSHSVCFAYWNFFLFFVPLIYNLAHRCDHCYCMTFGFCAFYPLIQALRNYVAWSYSKYIFSVVLIHLNLLAAHFIWNFCFTSLR